MGKSLGSGLAVRGYPVAGDAAIRGVEVDVIEPNDNRNGNHERDYVADEAGLVKG